MGGVAGASGALRRFIRSRPQLHRIARRVRRSLTLAAIPVRAVVGSRRVYPFRSALAKGREIAPTARHCWW